jgi:multiple antibiotic resistance protein
MEQFYHTFVHSLFIGIIALFPVINPIGSAFIVNPYFTELTRKERRGAVKQILIYTFLLCTIAFFAGHYILALFGISIPVVQLAGGIMICKIGWEFLTSDKDNEEEDKKDEADEKDIPETTVSDGLRNLQNKLFFPITFPITAGAGTISVLFTLSAHSAASNDTDFLLNAAAVIVAVVVMCVLVYIFYNNTETLINYLGSNGEKIVNRITSFLIFCVGLQIAVTGIKAIFKI